MKMKNFPKNVPYYCMLFTLFLVFLLNVPRSAEAQVLKIAEAISWMNKTKAQVLGRIASEKFTYQGKEEGFIKYSKRYSMGVCHLTIAFKNDKLDVISWNEYVGYAGELRGEVTLEEFEQTESFDIVSGFKNYDRRLILTLIDHSATANEIGVTIGRMMAKEWNNRNETHYAEQTTSKMQNEGKASSDPSVFRKVDRESEFVGGASAFLQYLNMHLRYPDTAFHNGVEGTVLVQFLVDTDGSVSDVEAVEGEELGYGLVDEAVRVISNMPKWTPARQGNKNVKSYKRQPIVFRLPKEIIKPSGNYDRPKAIFKGVNGTGTKMFCDGLGGWYYKVTISGNDITLQLYADKKNESQKDHIKPVETIRGVIQDNKIITKDATEYKTNRFKFENGILYEVNDEGEYNEYKECQN